MFKEIILFGGRLVVLLQLLAIVHAQKTSDYCKLTCEDEPTVHTMCKFPKSGPSKACSKVISSGLSNEEQNKIVALHNKLRQQVASGKETRGKPGPQPAAKSMPNLEWDEELATIAQRWADQCEYDHDCSPIERFDTGQNLAQKKSSNDKYDVETMVLSWYDEVADFNANDVSSFVDGENSDGDDVGHYTQLVWATTTKIGCGMTRYQKDLLQPTYYTYLVCNYGESGNVEDEPVYETE